MGLFGGPVVTSGEEDDVKIAEGQEYTSTKIDGVAGVVAHAEMKLNGVQLGIRETGSRVHRHAIQETLHGKAPWHEG